MRRILLLAAFLYAIAAALAQTENTTIQPDCLVPFTLTAAGNSPTANVANAPNDNRTKGCAAWTLKYQNTGMTGVTVTLQSGCSTSTTVSYGTFAGTIPTTPASNANPIVSDTGGQLQAINGIACISWVRVNVAATGTGTLTGVLYGFRNSSAAVNGSGPSNCPPGSSLDLQVLSATGTQGTCTSNAAFVANYTALAVPSAPVITHAGTAGTSTWGYKVVCGFIGGMPVGLGSAASTEGQTATGNATLTSMSYNIITVPTAAGGETSCDIYRTTTDTSPTATGLIGNVANGSNLHDTGLPVIHPFDYPNSDYSVGVGSSIPYVNTSGGSAFGCYAAANLANWGDTVFAGVGLNILTSDACPDFAGSPSLSVQQYIKGNGSYGASGFFEVAAVGGTNLTIVAMESEIDLIGATTASTVSALVGQVNIDAASTVGGSSGFYPVNASVTNNGTVTTDTWMYNTNIQGSGTFGNIFEFFGFSLDSVTATNKYYEWHDSQGVFRIRADNSFNAVYQAIPALYNPQFTKYTPGAANYERIVEQWESNEGWLRTEAGGTGALRRMGLGSAGLDVSSGDVAQQFTLTKITAVAAAPGATIAGLHIRAGTNAGTCKVTVNAGTSATEITIVDNAGTGC